MNAPPKGSAPLGLTLIALFVIIWIGAHPKVTFRPCEGGLYRTETQWWGFQKKTNYLEFYGDCWHMATGKKWRVYHISEDDPEPADLHGWDMN